MLQDAQVCPTLPTTDLKEAREFYKGKLGLKIEHESEGGITFEAGNNSALYVYKRPPSHAEHTLASFQVEDLEAKVEEMTAAGIIFEQYDFPALKTDEKGIAISEEEGEKAAWFKDPDGNILAVNQKME